MLIQRLVSLQEGETDTDRERVLRTEPEMGGSHPHAKGCQRRLGPPEAARVRKEPPLEVLREQGPATPGLWTSRLHQEALQLGSATQSGDMCCSTPEEANPCSCFAFSLSFHRLHPLSLTSWSQAECHRLRGRSHPAWQT